MTRARGPGGLDSRLAVADSISVDGLLGPAPQRDAVAAADRGRLGVTSSDVPQQWRDALVRLLIGDPPDERGLSPVMWSDDGMTIVRSLIASAQASQPGWPCAAATL